MRNQIKGFSLLELLIAVAIIGIIAGIGYPKYQGYIVNAKRADGKTALVGFASSMDRWLTQSGSYAGAAAGGANSGSPDPSIYASQVPSTGTANYLLTIVSSSATTYQIKATPQFESTPCMYIDQTGNVTTGGC